MDRFPSNGSKCPNPNSLLTNFLYGTFLILYQNPKHMCTSKCGKKQLEVMLRCCLATQHRLGHPGKQGNRETWDGVPSPNPIREGVGKWRRLRHTWEIAHQTRQSTGTGLTISRLARPMCDITVGHESIKKSTKCLQCRADHEATKVLTASDHVGD